MRLKPAITIVVLIPAFLLAACGGSPKSAGSNPPPTRDPSTADKSWIGRNQVAKVITLLQKGDAMAARKILADVLDQQPSDAIARSLVKQIDEDPVVLLGAENFSYTARKGDSFATLAQRYLGDPILFYALARYNHVISPASLTNGIALRIPGHAKREAPRAELKPEPDTHAAAPLAKPVPVILPAPANDPVHATQLRAQGLEAMNRGAIDRAIALLGQASRLDPSNALIKRDLQRAIRIRRTVQGK